MKKKEYNYTLYDSSFATRLRKLIDDTKVKRSDLAELLGVSKQSIGQYCTGISVPPADKIVLLADYFDVSTDYLLGRTDVLSTDTTVRSICEYTGLNECSVYTLTELKDMEKRDKIFYYLNYFLSDSFDCLDFLSLAHNVIWEKLKRTYIKELIFEKYNIPKDIDFNYDYILKRDDLSDDEKAMLSFIKSAYLKGNREENAKFNLCEHITKELDEMWKRKPIDKWLQIEPEIKHYKEYINLRTSEDRKIWVINHICDSIL